jgi:hypothetical protein
MSKPPAAYSINHDGLILDIALVKTDKLLIHEEIIPYRLDKLKARIEQDGVQSAPIVVDRSTHVVLDGMHRTAIMRELGCSFTCVCLIDYFDPRVKVQRWCRVVPFPFNAKKAEELFDELGLEYEQIDLVESPEDDGSLMLVFKDSVFKVITDEDDLVEAFRKSHLIEQKLENLGYKITHCTESEAQEALTNGSYQATLYLPSIEKAQVLDLAIQHKILTPKATRHNLPARPVGVNVPLSLLRNTCVSLDEANQQLHDLLTSKTITRYDARAEWMGRIYDEALYVFSEP